MTQWPFADPPDTAVLILRTVLGGAEWIGWVAHDDEDGGWQFMGNRQGEVDQDQAAIVELAEVVALDASVAALADLAPGWRAWRPARDAPWQRTRAE